MKSIKKIVLALLFSVFCIGCNNSNKTIKITINSGVGTFADDSTITTLLVKSGTKLSECKFSAPSISVYGIEDLEFPEDVPVLNYLTKNNKVYEDTPITSDTILYANYYESLEEEKEISKHTITDVYEEISKLEKIDIVTAKYNEAINKIDNSTTSYELFLLVNAYNLYLRALDQIGEVSELPLLISLYDTVLSTAEKFKSDQRSMSYIVSLDGFLFTAVLKHDQTSILRYKQIFTVINKYVEDINPNISYAYGIPFDSLLRATGQQLELMKSLTSFYTFAEACTHCDTVVKAYGLGKPLVALTFAGVLRPDLIPMYMDIYQDFVEYTLNS